MSCVSQSLSVFLCHTKQFTATATVAQDKRRRENPSVKNILPYETAPNKTQQQKENFLFMTGKKRRQCRRKKESKRKKALSSGQQ